MKKVALIFFLIGLSFSLMRGCGKNSNSNSPSELDAIESKNLIGNRVDRVYLAIDEANIKGVNTRVYYIIGCHLEGAFDSEIAIYHPLEGSKEMMLHERKWLYDFNPVFGLKDPKPGDCEVLFGAPSVQKFGIETKQGDPFNIQVGLAAFSCFGGGKAGADVNLDLKKVGYSLPKYLSEDKIRHPLILAAGLGAAFLCYRYAYSFSNYLIDQRKKQNVELFSRIFDHAVQTAHNRLQYEENELGYAYRTHVHKALKENNEESMVAASGYLSEKTVEIFNSEKELWSKSTHPEVKKGTFYQGLSTDVVKGDKQFFDAIKSLKPVKWVQDTSNYIYDVPDDYRATVKVKCNSLRIRDFHLTKINGGAPVYRDEQFSDPLGNIPVGTSLYKRQYKHRTHSKQIPAIQARLLDESLLRKLGINKDFSVWLHPAFVEVSNGLPCNPYLEP